MQHQGSDYGSSHYYPHQYPSPNPNPNEFPPPPNPSFASAPPYSSNYYSTTPEFPTYPSPYPSYAPPPPPIPDSNPSQFPQFQPPPPAPASSAPYPHLQQPPYYPYEPSPAAAAYGAAPPAPQNANPSPYPLYENPYETSPRFDHGTTGGGGYFGEYSYKGYDRLGDDGLGDGVYAYDGGRTEPYGARGTGEFSRPASNSSGAAARFDDYGRSIGVDRKDNQSQAKQKIVRAVPKMDTQQDAKNGVQKFRVKLLPEGASVTTMDVLCQIGLDGIRMLDPSTSRMLRIYPLENITRWEVLDSSIFAFWSKSSVDIEPRRIRLQSNSYTTNTILDTVTAATVQLKEMGGKDSLSRNTSADSGKQLEQTTEKKRGFDWMNLIKPGNEEKDHWVPDEAVSKCTSCFSDFGAFLRRHHCRNCGDIFCDKCTQGRIALTAEEQAQPVRVCDRCMAEVSHRLSNAKEIASKSTGLHSHEDLAKKLQEEMEKNRKSSSVSKSTDGSGRRMREVACPICTVHLQVQVPSSGSETIECGVCQHPFLVSSH
ncbi:protein FREE1 [Iris pallida]|uniref:Protein FREE1 n=1 Tax=Iris pallida TaxID=29817 RepID=A0AAX6EE60_IRIPA|nr:protein FREE1 [Iris pallida]